jgi:hypothetical protein
VRALLKRVAILLSVAALLTAGMIGVGCSKAKEGQLPAYKVGDTWTYEEMMEGSYYTVTYEVTGEDEVDGMDCWTVKQTISPEFMGMSSMTAKIDKANLFPLQGQGSGSMMGMPFSVAMDYSYQPSDASYYPLEIGEEVSVTETHATTATVAGQTGDPETETKTHVYKVEAKEEITVEAGTFTCFKITDGDATIWYSDKVKQDIKRIEDDGSTQELTSYSI